MRVRLRFLIGLLAAGAICAAAGVIGAGAQTPAAPSPEEGLLSILPYKLQASDLIPGFVLGSTGAVTPSELALSDGQGTDPDTSAAALRKYQRAGVIVRFSQNIEPNDITPARVFLFQVDLYQTADQASAALHDALDPSGYVDDTTTADNPVLPVRLGDESGALHIVENNPDSDNQNKEGVLWRRGRVAFTVAMVVLDSTETIDQVVPLAKNADQRAAVVGAPQTGARQALPGAGSEQYRLDALYGLYPRLPGSDLAPLGFRSAGIAVINNADLIATADDPQSTYTKVASSWRRVAAIRRSFGTMQGSSGDIIVVTYALDGDAAGAEAEINAPERQANSTIETFNLPAPLGDDSRFYHELYTGNDGVPRELWRALWVRGQVVVNVAFSGPKGDFTSRDASDFAAKVDAAYNRRALPNVLTAPLPKDAPSPTPPPIAR